jgi:beta-lactamase regulating signal transducer with metallopeptidase domain/biotin carboxyl carrier protein
MSPPGLVLLALGWSAAVWAVASLICRKGPSPKVAQAIWRSAALALPAPFAASLIVPGFSVAFDAPLADLPMLEPVMIVPQAGGVAAAPASGVELPGIGTLIVWLVCAGWAVRVLLWGVSQVRLQRLKARAMRTSRPIGHWAEAVGLARAPQVYVIPRGAPFLAGLLKRAVYVPAALIRGEGAQQVIVHELVHLKRGDLIARPLERIVADLFWFSPFAWWIRGQLDFWREAVVDEETVELTGDRIAYARTLTSAARISRDEAVLPVAAFILRKKGNLKMRLNELLTEKPRPRRLGLVLAAALVCAAPLALAQGMLIKGAAAGPGQTLFYSHAVLEKARLTSAFGMRKHPTTGEKKMHSGVDLAAEEGTPVYAPTDGVVTVAEMTRGYGNLVQLMAGGETVLRFGQLSAIDVEPGDVVKPGDVIGKVGQSGVATGPHLHFEVLRNGDYFDPQAEEGLVLADSLFILSGSGGRVPVPPAPTAEPAPPEPAAAPLSPEPVSAPLPPEDTEELMREAQAAQAACKKLDAWFEAPVQTAAWSERKLAARNANKQAGLQLDAKWVPETVSYPAPVYPTEAAQSGKTGACLVMFDLGTDGMPQNTLATCSDPVFAESAAALPGAAFKPFTGPDGQPVEVKGVTYPLSYCMA